MVAWRGERAARAPKPKSCATSYGTSSKAPCAASFTCPSFMCHLRAGVGGSRPGRHASQPTFFFLCLLKGCVRRVLYMPALYKSTATVTRPATPTKGFKRSKSASRDDEETADEETADEETLEGGGVGGSWG